MPRSQCWLTPNVQSQLSLGVTCNLIRGSVLTEDNEGGSLSGSLAEVLAIWWWSKGDARSIKAAGCCRRTDPTLGLELGRLSPAHCLGGAPLSGWPVPRHLWASDEFHRCVTLGHCTLSGPQGRDSAVGASTASQLPTLHSALSSSSPLHNHNPPHDPSSRISIPLPQDRHLGSLTQHRPCRDPPLS
jgi:hypothetical protein